MIKFAKLIDQERMHGTTYMKYKTILLVVPILIFLTGLAQSAEKTFIVGCHWGAGIEGIMSSLYIGYKPTILGSFIGGSDKSIGHFYNNV